MGGCGAHLPAPGTARSSGEIHSGVLFPWAAAERSWEKDLRPAQLRFFTEPACVLRAGAGCREMGIRIFSKRSVPSISPNQRLTPQKPSAAAGPGGTWWCPLTKPTSVPRPSQIKSRLPSRKAETNIQDCFSGGGSFRWRPPPVGCLPSFPFF